jgi:GNAT superfamily N-acetyltransferase
MKINEIEKIPSRSYTGRGTLDEINAWYGDDPNFKPFRDDFYRAFVNSKFLIAIKNPNPKQSAYKIVASLSFYDKQITNIYGAQVLEVGTIAVNPKYRGQGLARDLYSSVLYPPRLGGLGAILFAGDTQTPGGRAMWANMNNIPGVEVTGWASAHDTDTDYGDYSFDDIVKFLEQQGGSYFGEKKINYINTIRYYYEFAVEQLPTRRELEIMGKRSPVKVYDGGARSGLLARYVG